MPIRTTRNGLSFSAWLTFEKPWFGELITLTCPQQTQYNHSRQTSILTLRFDLTTIAANCLEVVLPRRTTLYRVSAWFLFLRAICQIPTKIIAR
jgi:hypothetical protein